MRMFEHGRPVRPNGAETTDNPQSDQPKADQPKRPNPAMRTVTGTRDVLGAVLQGVGAIGAYTEEIPLLGFLLIRPLAFAGENTRKGFLDAKVRIAARKAQQGEDPVGQADSILSDEEKKALQNRATQVATSPAGA